MKTGVCDLSASRLIATCVASVPVTACKAPGSRGVGWVRAELASTDGDGAPSPTGSPKRRAPCAFPRLALERVLLWSALWVLRILIRLDRNIIETSFA